MKRHGPLSGDEEDAFHARGILFWQRGELKRIKRRYAKKERRDGQEEARER